MSHVHDRLKDKLKCSRCFKLLPDEFAECVCCKNYFCGLKCFKEHLKSSSVCCDSVGLVEVV